MNLKKKSFILAITLLLGIVFLPGVTKAALENPFDGPYVSATLFQDEFINEGQYPFDIQTAEGSWAKGEIENFFLDTYIESPDYLAQMDVSWWVWSGTIPVQLSFNYQVETGLENSIVWNIDGIEGNLIADGEIHHFYQEVTMNETEYDYYV